MALVVADRIKETTSTTGTGTYTLAGASTGFEAFSVIGNSNTTYYCCTDGTDFEVGIGTYTASGTTLARTTILQSSNSDSAVNWGSGTRDIFVTQPAEKAVFLDASGDVAISRDTDASAEIGRAHIGNVNHGDFAGFSHVDQDSQTTYALLQQGDGHTYLNAASGQEISFRINNTDVMNMTSAGLDITGTLTVDPATASGAGHKFSEWNASTNADIDGLLPGSTFGSLYQGFPVGHMVLALSENDSNDSVAIISGGGNYNSDTTYDTLIARFRANGDTHLNKVIATELDISGDVDVDGTLEADTITLNGTSLASSATTDTTDASNISSGTLNASRLPDLTVSELAADSLTTSSESFADNDTTLMTSAAINDRIESFGYSTTTGTVTSVGTTGTVNGITLTGTVTSSGNLTLGGTLGSITVSQLAGSALTTSSESFADNDTTLMTSAAINDRIESFGYTTNTGDITGVTAGTGLSGGGSSGGVTLNVSGLTVSELAANSLTTSSESFADNDTTLMTSAAINDRIESFGYTTNTGDITGVTAGTGLSGGGSSGGVTLNVSGITVSELAADSLTTSSESFADNDTTLMTSAAINDRIESFGYTTNTGDITGVTAGTGLSGGGSSGGVTLNVDLSELTDMTQTMVGADEFIVLDNGADRRKAASEIGLSIFNNDSGFITSADGGTATNVTVSANNSTNESVFLTFVDGATGTQGIETDTSLTYNPSTNLLSTGALSTGTLLASSTTTISGLLIAAGNEIFTDGSELQIGNSQDTVIQHTANTKTTFNANTSTGGMEFQDGGTALVDFAVTSANTTTFKQTVDFSNATVTGLASTGASKGFAVAMAIAL